MYLLKCLQLLVFYDLAFIRENYSPLSFTNPPPLDVHIHPSDMSGELYLAWQLKRLYLLQTSPVLTILLRGCGNSGEHIQVVDCGVPAGVL